MKQPTLIKQQKQLVIINQALLHGKSADMKNVLITDQRNAQIL